MNQRTDSDLLSAYVHGRAEADFSELVGRHLDFVYSAAIRMVRDPHLAEDVTQGVFVALATSAHSLTERPVLAGWLHRTARNIAAQTIRTIERRRAREQESARLTEIHSEGTATSWDSIAPHLDSALSDLPEPDRDVIMLRYFERRSAHEIAQQIGVSGEAAQKRVSRALDRLRQLLAEKGITCSADGLAAVIVANAVHTAPPHLAYVAAKAVGFMGVSAAATKAFSVTAIPTIAMTSLKKALLIAAFAVTTATGIYEARRSEVARRELTMLKDEQLSLLEQAQQRTRELEDAAQAAARLQRENENLRRDTSDLIRLRAEVARLQNAKAAKVGVGDPGIAAAVSSLVSKIDGLKQKLQLTPSLNIPELQFAKDRDWMEAASEVKTDTDEGIRRGLGHLRSVCKQRFAIQMMRALQAYTDANNGALPIEVSHLAEYFKSPVDARALDRYRMIRTGDSKALALGENVIEESSTADVQYDTLYRIGLNGAGTRFPEGYLGSTSQLGLSVDLESDELDRLDSDAAK